MSAPSDGFASPAPQPFGKGDPIPANGDGEHHPDVTALRHALADPASAHLADADDFPALANRLGDGWTVKRLKAAHAYIKGRSSAPRG